ncbi:hypothetical protein [Nitrosospira briensis]|uniref:hypothetical protein n=1 Tax=Nitrosospira briensis TaxID=35799 RepID=UPI0008E18BAD|nr:hypothetical protein [Nitrosospira briensis]SFN73180.1 hypothetical protein SAMN05216332_101404 [Nitrosospira briensis]
MAVIILPHRLKNQPQYAAPIDYAGLAKGVQILWNPAAGPVDLVTGRAWASGGNAAIATTQGGRAFSFDGADDYYGYTGYPEITGNTGSFFMWCPTVGAADTHGHALFGASSPVGFAHQINPGLQVHISSTPASIGTLPSWFKTKNRSIVLASGGTAATCKAFLDGTDSGLKWAGPPVAWGAGNKNFNLGRYPGGTLWDFSGTILIAGYSDAVWGEAESRAFHENPWQLLKTRTRKLWSSSGSAHILTGASSIQPNESNAKTIAQHHVLVGSVPAQAGESSVEAITQDQILAVVPGSQVNASSAGAITADLSFAAKPNNQINTFETGAIRQAHGLLVIGPTQESMSSASGVIQAHGLVALAPVQANTSGTGPLYIGKGGLAGAPSIQANTAGNGSVAQTYILVAAASSQLNKAGISTISNAIVVEASLISGIVEAFRIKKPGIPPGTPEWLKTMIEILTGRRGNRIAVPRFQALTFSATPTRAECEALYRYTNAVRDSLEQLITRMDS